MWWIAMVNNEKRIKMYEMTSLKQSSKWKTKKKNKKKTMMTLKMHSFNDGSDRELSLRSNVITLIKREHIFSLYMTLS